MKAAEINRDGSYMVSVAGTLEVVRVTRIGQTVHQKYQRPSYRCKVLRNGQMRTCNDSKCFKRLATAAEIAAAKGE